MVIYDFEFDGIRLSEKGFILCNFGSKGLETISNGSQTTFNTVSTLGGSKHNLTNVTYDNCLESVFQICKNSCSDKDMEISSVEFRQLTKWLSRKSFLKFKLLSEEHIDIYYEVKFDINRIEINGKLYGLELTAQTNRPFALQEQKTIIINNKYVNGNHTVNDTSHEEGYIYPHTEIIVVEDGDIDIYNALEDRHTIIKNCVSGEIITMDYPIIQSSISSHEIQNDFNWNFFRIANTFDNSRNDIKVSIPCSIKIKYSPIVKVGL